MSLVSDEDRQRRMEIRQAEQLARHLADPFRCPKYIPADEPGLETEAWTAAGPEEPN